MSESEERPINEGDAQAAQRPTWELPAELKSLEAQLAALSPHDDRLDRERLMFLAGRASAEAPFDTSRSQVKRPHQKAWPAAFAAMTTVAATLLVILIARPVRIAPPTVHVVEAVERESGARSFIAEETNFKTSVLSIGDARRHDIEQLLSAVGLPTSDDMANVAMAERDSATLTPAAWRAVLEGVENARPISGDSSDTEMRKNQGVNS